MRKLHILTLFIALGFTNANSQCMADVFMKMPIDVCPLLNEYNKLEMCDNQKNGKAMSTRNQLFGSSEMKALTEKYALLQTTKNSQKEMKILECSSGEKIIIVISTVLSDGIYDSDVAFYDLTWKKLNQKDYIKLTNTEEFNHITIAQDSDELTVTECNPLLLNFDDNKKLADLQIENARMKWNGKRFE